MLNKKLIIYITRFKQVGVNMLTNDNVKNALNNIDESCCADISILHKLISQAQAVVIGAGSGLSTSAGLQYAGERFEKLMPDFIAKYHLKDMYSAAFYKHNSLEEHWAYWSWHIYHNRYHAKLNNTYPMLYNLMQNKNFFVLTTNGDHLFLLNNFPKERIFYTQGDYGLLQCSVPCHEKTYKNEEIIHEMVKQQKDYKIPSELIPLCPRCKKPMTVNLRMDSTFVEEKGWHDAAERYQNFLCDNKDKKVLFLELGVGSNTPGIIKYPFWKMTNSFKNANYACINFGEAIVPKEIQSKSICINADINQVLNLLVDENKV